MAIITRDIEGRPTLDIFNSFVIDGSLPKHRKAVTQVAHTDINIGVADNGSEGWTTLSSNVIWGSSQGTISARPNWLTRISLALFGHLKQFYLDSRATPVEEIFEAITVSL